MTATEQKLYVFTYLDTEWVPCGQLTLSEDGAKLSASTFAYGLRYLQRPGALEVDPVSLSLRDMALVRGTALFPPNNLPLFGGIRDAAPDAWGRRVLESRRAVPAKRLPGPSCLGTPVRLVHFGSRTVMLIRRFDRYWAKAGQDAQLPEDLLSTVPAYGLAEKRLGFISGLTLLACDEMESPNKSYGDLAQAVRRYCHPGVIRENNRELFERLVFNIFVNNDDDHLRNHGFVWDPRLPGWRLSPLYDVMPRASLASERRLHLGVGPEGRIATLDNAFAGREMFTLSAEAAAESIARIWKIVREWKVYFEEYQVPSHQIERIAPAFRHIDDLSTRSLRKLIP